MIRGEKCILYAQFENFKCLSARHPDIRTVPGNIMHHRRVVSFNTEVPQECDVFQQAAAKEKVVFQYGGPTRV